MRDALAAHNKAVEWIEYADEPTAGGSRRTRIDFWRRVERLLEKNLK